MKRTKNLKQIAAQVLRINSALTIDKMTDSQAGRFWTVSEIGRRYQRNALAYAWEHAGFKESAIIPVPFDIYTK